MTAVQDFQSKKRYWGRGKCSSTEDEIDSKFPFPTRNFYKIFHRKVRAGMSEKEPLPWTVNGLAE